MLGSARTRNAWRGLACLAAGVAIAASAGERVSLVPDRAAPGGVARLLASLRDGARASREIVVTSSPAGARLELAYLRDGIELARAGGVAPLRVLLPAPAATGAGDRVVVRAELAGHAPAELAFVAKRARETAHVELAPLPSALLAVSLLELGDRSRLLLQADRALEPRLVATPGGWRLVLANTSAGAALRAQIAQVRGRALAGVAARAVGGDLFLELSRRDAERREPRLVPRAEPVRARHALAIEWLPEDRGAATLARARRALAAVSGERLGDCAGAFERALRGDLGVDALARALAPHSAFDAGLLGLVLERAAAATPDGRVTLRDGGALRVDLALERAAALARIAEVEGALVAVHELAGALGAPGEEGRTLSAWLAPERPPHEFSASFARALAEEARCRARS